MNYIVLDLEWNQPMDAQEKINEQLPFEIIEIGAVKLNSDKEQIGTFSKVVKPAVYTAMNHITRRLLNISENELDHGNGFRDVMEEFLAWCGSDYVFCTWGTLDLMELQRNMDYYGMTPIAEKPFAYYDVQKLFSLQNEDGKSRRSLEYVVDYMKLAKNEQFHRALYDACYTAEIFATFTDPYVLEKYSFDTYRIPRNKEDEIDIVFSNYAKYISREFEDKQEAIADRKVSSMRCYLCRKNIKRRIKWFCPNGKHYYGVGYCDIHQYVKFKVRMKKSQDEHVYVVKTARCITRDEFEQLNEKMEKTKLQKKLAKKKQNAAGG